KNRGSSIGPHPAGIGMPWGEAMRGAGGPMAVLQRRWKAMLIVSLMLVLIPVVPLTRALVPESRLVAAGDVHAPACGVRQEEGTVPALRAAWWWLWTARRDGGDPGHQYAIVIDTFTETLTLFRDGEVFKQYPVAVGKPATPTPPGEWRVTNKSTNWGGGFGTRWNGLNVPWGIYGIHGTNQPHAIGRHVSGGCIRMFNRDVEELYDIIPIGTPVTIYGPLPSVAPRPSIGGGSGKFILVMQLRLRQAGFDPGSVDGRFGPATERSIADL